MSFLVASVVLIAIVAVATVWDLRSMRIPDTLNAVMIASGLAANGVLGHPIWDAVIGAFAGYGAIWLMNQLYRRWRGREGIGMGDAKMLAGAGAWVGWAYLPFVLLGASLIGVGYAVARGLTRTARLPFGPFIGVSLLAVWFASGYRLLPLV
ncbi:MAG: prepilin peptidase [Hyphomonadaceae bacterium]|nr:prepilin peptidase [Hyphomonadaceae bacterium]